MHMAFFIWSPGSILTHPCDEDVAKQCLKARPNMDAVPGAVGSCLADIVSAWRAVSGAGRLCRRVWAMPAACLFGDCKCKL